MPISRNRLDGPAHFSLTAWVANHWPEIESRKLSQRQVAKLAADHFKFAITDKNVRRAAIDAKKEWHTPPCVKSLPATTQNAAQDAAIAILAEATKRLTDRLERHDHMLVRISQHCYVRHDHAFMDLLNTAIAK